MRNTVLSALIAGGIVLVLINLSIWQKETLLNEGEVIYLQLAPVDPRSLMQGDYMALRFQIGNDIRTALRQAPGQIASSSGRLKSQDGMVVVTIDAKGIGHFSHLDNQQPLASNERRMTYRVRNGRVKFATNAYFFQEGNAERYAQAQFGEFRVAEDGELLLTGMRNSQLKKLAPGNAEALD